MKNIFEYINEHYVNALKKEDMVKYADEIWDMLQNAYKSIGGTAGLDSKEQLIDETDMWKMVRKNGKILAVRCYTFKRGGRKSCYCATNGTPEGKEALYNIIKEDAKMKHRDAWSECSGKMEHIYLKHGFTPVPAKVAQKMMADKEFRNFDEDGLHYERKIGDKWHRKMMVGNFVDIDLEKFMKQNVETAERERLEAEQAELNKEIKL